MEHFTGTKHIAACVVVPWLVGAIIGATGCGQAAPIALPSGERPVRVAFRLGGPENDCGTDIAVTADGAFLLVGYFGGSVGFDPADDTRLLIAAGDADIFVAKYDRAGGHQWSFNVGGPGFDMAHAVACDVEGCVYVTGYFSDTVDMDPSEDEASIESRGKRDIFIAKYSPDGRYLWSFGFGSEEDDEGMDLAWDGGGHLFATGFLRGQADLDPGPGSTVISVGGPEDAFLAGYDRDGNLLWGFALGGPSHDQGHAVECGPRGDVHLAGVFSRTVDFDPGSEETSRSSAGGHDVFLARYTEAGKLRWATTLGGPGDDFTAPGALATAPDGHLFLTGRFFGRVLVGSGRREKSLTSNGKEDIFLVRFTGSGAPVWATAIGGPSDDGGRCVAVGSRGQTYVAGWFRETVDFCAGPIVAFHTANGKNGASDAFVARYDARGEYYWAFGLGGAVSPEEAALPPVTGGLAAGLAVDPWDRLLLTGRFYQTADFDPSLVILNQTSEGQSDIFLLRLSPGGRLEPEPPAATLASDQKDRRESDAIRQRMRPAGPDEGPQFSRRNAARIFDRFDANGDGILTPNEIHAGAQDHLLRADTDGDGVVAKWELEEAHRRMRQQPRSNTGAR